jgi:hypothetical protein
MYVGLLIVILMGAELSPDSDFQLTQSNYCKQIVKRPHLFIKVFFTLTQHELKRFSILLEIQRLAPARRVLPSLHRIETQHDNNAGKSPIVGPLLRSVIEIYDSFYRTCSHCLQVGVQESK